MAIEADLYTRLTGHAGLGALVGTRVYPLRAPQDAALPYITYQRISGVVLHEFARAAPATQARYQVDVWAGSFLAAQTAMTQLRAALIAMTGNTVTLHEVLLDGSRDEYEPETGLYRASQDALMLYGGT